MLSRFDPLYDVLDSFLFHEARFKEGRELREKRELEYNVDAICSHNFYHFRSFLPNGPWHEDLLVANAVDYILQPKHCPTFLQEVYRYTPRDLATTLYRQEGVRELTEKPDLARRIEDGLESLSAVNSSLKARDNRLYFLEQEYHHAVVTRSYRNMVLKPITPYNLQLLALYIQSVERLAETLKETESRPLQRAYRFLTEEVMGTEFFKDIHPVFEITYFKDDRVSLDVTLARDGSYRAAILYRREGESMAKDINRAVAKAPARLWGFLHTLQLPSTYVMDATNRLVEFHRQELLHPSRIIGPLEFYTAQAGFHRRMQEAGEEVNIPEVLPSQERRLFFPNARNPLLMYQKIFPKNESRKIIIHSERKAVGSDIKYDTSKNIAIITGPNQAGKSVFIRTAGLLLVHALQGGALPIGKGGYVSVVDGIYTHFSGEDDLAKGEGTFLQELRRYRKEVFSRITPYSLALLDEPTTGTDTDGSTAILTRILQTHQRLGTATFVTTHQHRIGDLVDGGILSAGYTLCPELISDQATGKPIKTFRIIPGRSATSLAEEVAELAGMSADAMEKEILNRISAGELDLGLFRA